MAVETTGQNQAVISLSVDGRQLPFKFQKRSGGKYGSSGSKTVPGGVDGMVAHGGIREREDLTLEFELVPSRDLPTIKFLENRVSKGDIAGEEHLLDKEGNVLDVYDSFTGVLSEFDPGQYDATSSDRRMCTIVCELDS
ncbi:MAG TPA: hypothetical protein VMS11_04670 [Solirubrobacterales bacterium]|nr:hypothetical protein [Solirubrobacterales bacterium]